MAEHNIYSNSKIYKIVSATSNKIYIGSTTQTLAQRLGKYLSNYKDYTINNKGYITSFEIIKFGDYSIKLIEECNYNNKQQLHKREGYYIKLYRDISINKVIAGRTIEEYAEDNKQVRKEKMIEYKNNNKQIIKEIKKQCYKKHNNPIICECGIIITIQAIKVHLKRATHFTNINKSYLDELTTL